MNKLLILLAGIALAGAAAAAAPDASQGSSGAAAPRAYHYWLHPKLGMVKVDRVTHAVIVPGKQRAIASAR